jgi:hypothetical protein
MYLGDDAEIRRWTAGPPLPILRIDFRDPNRFGSAHSAGAMFVNCDGSVGIVDFEVDPKLFERLGDRRDGEMSSNAELR